MVCDYDIKFVDKEIFVLAIILWRLFGAHSGDAACDKRENRRVHFGFEEKSKMTDVYKTRKRAAMPSFLNIYVVYCF